uniref:Chromosome 19 open reading frame 67 n=1 Tax=Callorhinchus milii TaxID=7868 RepID=A0A4W3K6P6_CALMI
MEEKLQPIEQQLQYLLKKAEEFQTHLVYRDRIHNEEFARAVPIFVKTCQPYFAYLESTARSAHSDRKPLPEYIQKRLLQFSQQLASSLEQLVLMYASFGFISLEETDPCSICYFYRGEFRLRQWLHISIFRYCMPVPYTAARQPRLLFKKIRWNVDINQGSSFGDLNQTYFLCYKEAGEVTDPGNQPSSKPANGTGKTRRLWSIGRWVQVEPSPGEIDLFLYKQPRADYQLLITIGFEEPSQITATDLLVDILINQIIVLVLLMTWSCPAAGGVCSGGC